MCFDIDYDWYPNISEDNEVIVRKTIRCVECRCLIHVGETARHLYMQENDEAEWDEDDGEFQTGETFDGWFCLSCSKVLQAIQAAELEEGCGHAESQPYIGDLKQAMCEDHWQGGGKYADKAIEMFPEVAGHLWRLLPDPNDDESMMDEFDWDAGDLDPVEELGGSE